MGKEVCKCVCVTRTRRYMSVILTFPGVLLLTFFLGGVARFACKIHREPPVFTLTEISLL